MPVLARCPAPYNWAMGNRLIKGFLARRVGMVDSPEISRQALRRCGIPLATPARVVQLSEAQRARAVILVQDAFTSYFETGLVLDVIELLGRLGFQVLVAPFKPNGKPLHVHGFLGAFNKAAQGNSAMLKALADSGLPLVGIDPSMTLTYRQEYAHALPEAELPEVLLIQEWLGQHQEVLAQAGAGLPVGNFRLLPHCTEKTSAAPSIRAWQGVFAALGQTLEVLEVGCCGMSGTYGHESANYQTSKRIYELSWRAPVNDEKNKGKLVATGYSCRSQVKRLDEQRLPHPLQALLAQLVEAGSKGEFIGQGREPVQPCQSAG